MANASPAHTIDLRPFFIFATFSNWFSEALGRLAYYAGDIDPWRVFNFPFGQLAGCFHHMFDAFIPPL
jgi:hypothetical protein